MKKKILFSIFFLAVISIYALLKYTDFPALESADTDVIVAPLEPPPALTLEQKYPYVILPGSTFANALGQLDVSAQDIHSVVKAARPYQDLGRLHAGIRFQILFSENDGSLFNGVRIKLSARDALLIQKSKGSWIAEKISKKVEIRVVTFKGKVQSSLWDSAAEAQMPPSLIAELAEIFAWQVDFAREVQVGDRWRLSVEEELIQGESIGWASILSAEYINKEEVHTAVLFRKNQEDVGYYAPDGSSLKRVFLKSPIQYGRISSGFQRRRLHPILKIARPHNGVDYAAPTGTPIRAVGDGVIVSMGYKGAAGNMISIRHNSIYATAYKHLSRFAKGIRSGSQVQQGDTIGYVGTTGLASGPHLHFEFFVNGRYVDPLGQKFPAADPIPKNSLAEFSEIRKNFLAYLPNWEQSQN